MTKKILIINGPNLNLLGEREESKYGKVTLEEVKKNCESHAKSINLEIKFLQSNIEGEIVTIIQKSKDIFNGIKGLSLKFLATGSILTTALFLWLGFSRSRNTALTYYDR